MTNTEFVTAMQKIYSEVRSVGGSIVVDGENRTRSADEGPYGSIKLSVQLAWDLMARLDSDELRSVVDRIEEIIRQARHCREAQENPLTKDPKAKCRPVVRIDESGLPEVDWMR
jgi:aromatic ring-opening dioxygenase LigB subunit